MWKFVVESIISYAARIGTAEQFCLISPTMQNEMLCWKSSKGQSLGA